MSKPIQSSHPSTQVRSLAGRLKRRRWASDSSRLRTIDPATNPRQTARAATVPADNASPLRSGGRPSRRLWLKTAAAAIAAGAWAVQTKRAQSAPPKTPRIQVGQIGVGHAHASKLSVFRESDQFEVIGIVEPDDELKRQAESQPAFRGVPWMTQEQLLNQSGLQLVLVETRVRDLLNAAEACVAAGKHVHLDKPAGESLPQFKRLLDAAARQRLLVQMGYMYRYNPGVVLLRKFLREGWLGELFEVHAVMSKVVGPADREKLAEYPGGIMFELGCHVLDLVVGALGAPREVVSVAEQVVREKDSLVDNMLAVLRYPHTIATVKSTALEVEGFARRHLVVCGTEGTFQIQPLDAPAARIALARPRGEYRAGYQDVALPKYTRYVDDAADMARIIRGEKEPEFSYQHDLVVQETLLRACGLPLEDTKS